MSYRLEIEYDGTDFHGWQVQKTGRTVQGELEEVLTRFFKHRITAIAAGRTDAGVHAEGQVVHFHTDCFRPLDMAKRALNAQLPKDINIRNIELAPLDFHARYRAHWRYYRYILATEIFALRRRYTWCPKFDYDFQRVLDATPDLIGRHDFVSFSLTGSNVTNTICNVYHAGWQEQNSERIFHIVANRFLRGMVRLIMGTLLEIGRGRFEERSIPKILAAKSSQSAGTSAPPQGLTLTKVGYEPWEDLP